jgi:hypothetical protein
MCLKSMKTAIPLITHAELWAPVCDLRMQTLHDLDQQSLESRTTKPPR